MRYVVEVLERYYVEIDALSERMALEEAPCYCCSWNYDDSEARIVEVLEDTDDTSE